MTWDVFISHASEDKADIARPLAELLQVKGYKVWYDEYTLTLGDNLRQSIEQGLAKSEYGVVVLSPNFFAKKWTNLELDGLFALEKPNKKRILPVWHKVSASDVESYSSFMAMRLGVPTSKGMDQVVDQIDLAIQRERSGTQQRTTTTTTTAATSTTSLHPHSMELVIAAKESNGAINTMWYLGGFAVSAGGRTFGPDSDPRTIALNLYCLEELEQSGLTEEQSDSLTVLTLEGFDFEMPEGVIQTPTPGLPNISTPNLPLAEEIMKGAVADDGRVHFTSYLSGHCLNAGAREWQSGGDRRTVARWKSVLHELEEKELLLPRSEEAYIVSHLGYLWTDELNLRENATPRK